MKHFKDKASMIQFAMGYTMGGLEKDLERMTKALQATPDQSIDPATRALPMNEPEHYTDDDRQQVQNMLADFQETMIRYDG